MKRFARWLPVLGWALLITYWSGQSDLPIDQPRISQLFHGQQHRLAHTAAFGVLALLVRFALDRTPRAALWAWLCATAFGLVDEWHQSFTPRRTPDPEDVLVDAVAAAAAVLLADAFAAGAPGREWRPSRLMAPVGVALVTMPLVFVLLEWHTPAPAVVRRQAAAVARRALPERYERAAAQLARDTVHTLRTIRGRLRPRIE